MEPRPIEEITALHAEFGRWLRGEGEEDMSRIESALAPDMTFVTAQGAIIERERLMADIATTFGSRQLRIRIENPTAHWSTSDMILATYEEWHEHADYITGRQSTAVFRIDPDGPNGVRWRHVHETWIEPPPHRR